jgi:hypothetical protein
MFFFSPSPARDDLNIDAGTHYTATAADLSLGNYSIAVAPVAAVWSNTVFVYTGTAQMPTVTATGVGGDGSLALTVTGAQTGEGSYTATATLAVNAQLCADRRNDGVLHRRR